MNDPHLEKVIATEAALLQRHLARHPGQAGNQWVQAVVRLIVVLRAVADSRDRIADVVADTVTRRFTTPSRN